MKSTKVVIVPVSIGIPGLVTQGKEYDVIRMVSNIDSVRAYYADDLGREDCTHFHHSCISGGHLRDGSMSLYMMWEARLIEVEQPVSELDQIIATAQQYAQETAERAIADALLPGGQIHAAFRAGGPFINDAFIRPGQVTIAPNEHTAKSDQEVLEVLRGILRVPDGENIITHAKVVRVMADALNEITNQ